MLAKELRSFFEKQDVKKKLIVLDQAIQAKNFWNNREEADLIYEISEKLFKYGNHQKKAEKIPLMLYGKYKEHNKKIIN